MNINRIWLAFANRKRCRHADAIHELGFISWRMGRAHFSIGDIVYLFMSDERKIRCKMVVTKENCKREDSDFWIEEAPNDIALPVVMVNDKIYYCGLNKMADAPDESQIAGRISDYTEPNTWPKTNDNTNVLCCVNQPYAFVDGELIVYAVNVHVNGKPIDYTVAGWFYCELYNPTYPDQ